MSPKRKVPRGRPRGQRSSRDRADHSAAARRAQQTQAAQAQAADRRTSWARRRRRRGLAVALFVLAAVVALGHVLEHLDVVRLMDPGLEDLLIGYPTAGVLLIVGGIVWGT